MKIEPKCQRTWIRGGSSSIGLSVTARTDLLLVSLHVARGPRSTNQPTMSDSDTIVDLPQGDQWSPSGTPWSVGEGQSCELRVIVLPKGGKAEFTVDIGGESFSFDCTTGNEAITAKFRLSVF